MRRFWLRNWPLLGPNGLAKSFDAFISIDTSVDLFVAPPGEGIGVSDRALAPSYIITVIAYPKSNQQSCEKDAHCSRYACVNLSHCVRCGTDADHCDCGRAA